MLQTCFLTQVSKKLNDIYGLNKLWRKFTANIHINDDTEDILPLASIVILME